MTSKIHQHVGSTQKEQGRADQVQNNAGGFVFELDPWKRLDRFLILGSEGNTYYQTERELTRKNIKHVSQLISQDGNRVVNQVVQVSDSGRAPKNDFALIILAACTIQGNEQTRHAAFEALPKVARTGTHLFQFVMFREALGGGWGRGMKRAIRNWYLTKPVDKLVYQILKYQNRETWSHRDLLRLSKPKTKDAALDNILAWAVGKPKGETPKQVYGVSLLQAPHVESLEVGRIIRDYRLTREMIPTELMTKPDVWAALLEEMPVMAMLRNLGNLSKCGLLTPLSDTAKEVVTRVENADWRKARVHPLHILLALRTYAQGHSMRGKGEWNVTPQVVDALDDAFYKAFEAVEPTGKNWLIGLDVSGSMASNFNNYPLMVCEAAACMGMVVARKEPNYFIHGFARTFKKLNITAKSTLAQATREAQDNNFGSTDCAVPMIHANQNNLPIDVFCVITDNETWAGNIHPYQALRKYRQKSGRDARLVVMGMTATNFSIADPNDAGMLDVCGFDASVPQLVSDFARGNI